MRTSIPFLWALFHGLSASADPGPSPKSSPVEETVQVPVLVGLMVPTEAIGARIQVDGMDEGQVPLNIYLEPGTHWVQIELSPNRFCAKTLEVQPVEGATMPDEVEGPDPFDLPRPKTQAFYFDCR